MAVFDLASEEEYQPRVQKVKALYDIYVLDTEHHFTVKVTYKKGITCPKEVLIEEFQQTYQKMKVMAY